MSVESLIHSAELDCFETPLSTPAFETQSETKVLVLTFCYGRGKPKDEISIPRLPQGVPTRLVIPEVDLRQLLPTRKRVGRGRARVLSEHAEDVTEPRQRAAVPRPVRQVPQKSSLFELPVEEPVCYASYPGATDVDTFDTYVSDDDDDDDNIDVLLPSQRGITNHPFGQPPKRKDAFNVKSADEFPTLGAPSLDAPIPTNTNNSTRSAQFFPPLPPRLSPKVTNCDIVFKPMKEKKSKKKRKCNNASSQRSVSESEESQSVCTGFDVNGVDEDSAFDQNGETVSTVSSVDSALPPDPQPIDVIETLGENWKTGGSHVIQIDGLRDDENDITGVEDFVSSYGTVLNFEKKKLTSGKVSVRVKYASSEGSEFAVSCLHETEGLVPETTVQCYLVGS